MQRKKGRALPEGFTVRFAHLRMLKSDVEKAHIAYLDGEDPRENRPAALSRKDLLELIEDGHALSPWGGSTVAHVYNAEGDEVASERAECSVFDPYNKAIGRDIALGRALKKLEAEG